MMINKKRPTSAGRVCPLLVALSLAVAFVGGCGGGSSSAPPSPHPEVLYATGFNQILSLKVNSSTGGLSAAMVTSGPDTTLGITATMAADPAGKFLFVYDTQGSAIDVFSISANTSALTPVSGSPFPAGGLGSFGGLAINSSGKFLYVVGIFGIDAFTVNSASGALTLVSGSPFADNNGPFGVVVAPPGKFLYTSDIGNPQATISGFSINSSTGALAPVPGSPFSTGTNGFPFDMAAHPSGKFLYAGIPATNTVEAWSIDSTTGTLTTVPGSPFAVGIGGSSFFSSVAVDPLGKFLYVSDDLGDIFGFAINSSSGALTAIGGSPFSFLAITDQMFIDPSGQYLYAPAGPFITGIHVDTTTGALTLLSGSPFSAGTTLTIPATLSFVKVSQ